MAPAKLNVLVYAGSGSTADSVRQCIHSLRHLLSPNYAVIAVSGSAILHEPWEATCALLVFPGGADLGYCRVFNGDGNRRIRRYVSCGGAYLGFCAGAYYASARCEFELGNGPLQVVGPRELAFYPGPCRGAAFKGFEYDSERGARAAILKIPPHAFNPELPPTVVSYFNGGGVFVDAEKAAGRKMEILASYDEHLDVDGGDAKAAVVLCHLGDGKALLSGPHPEFSAANLCPQPDISGYNELIEKLSDGDSARLSFLSACLRKLGLEVNQGPAMVPSLSALHLSAIDSSKVSNTLANWGEHIQHQDGCDLIRAEADTFCILHDDGPSIDAKIHPRKDGIPDYSVEPKMIIPHEGSWPSPQQTPRFHHELFYSDLVHFRKMHGGAKSWGDLLLYGDVVTSTNSLLDKNPKITSKLPTGFTFTASTQLAGRGRGSNVWVAPPGALMFSIVINHAARLTTSRPVVFLQYLAAISIVEAIQSYDVGYEKLPVKLKWPNDIYAADPTRPSDPASYVKIGGILSQCGYCDGAYQIVLGIGINATNPRPTTSISDLLPSTAPALRLETLLARILVGLESIYAQFGREGFSDNLEKRYYRHWLHSGQAIRLETEGGVGARVLGITRDWGMLRVEQTDEEGRGTGRIWTLQSDENSFDYWKGLVRRKE